MTDKEHHLTRKKREREEAAIKAHLPPESVADIEFRETAIEWDISTPYMVYDKRSNTVAYTHSYNEAIKELQRFVGGRIVKL